MRILIVCTGNICRSPAAHAVLEKKITEARARNENWANSIVVDSCGLGGWHAGDLPDRRAQKAGRKRGYELNHVARGISGPDLITTDLFLAMDQGHHGKLRRLIPPNFDQKNVRFWRSFDPHSRPNDEVADPYYGGDTGFEEMFDVIEASIPGLTSYLREQTEKK